MTANRQSDVSVSMVHGHLRGSFTEDKDSVTGKFCSRFFEQSIALQRKFAHLALPPALLSCCPRSFLNRFSLRS